MTQPPSETPDLPEEAIGGVPTEAPHADGAAGDGTVARTVPLVTVAPTAGSE
ncbi:hypothetical protein [Janibacter hoylei]|uniref:hypothetical protein n=1 Tax=Janibacter hoylei TaxID=364298 RepID=UPI0013004C23|nr:hypothetical protein [Janibacter hoylei]